MNKYGYDAIVIGAGLGGLTTAALLSNAGLKVLVLEQHTIVGGASSTFRRRKFIFDAAVHLIGGCESGGKLASILEHLGVRDRIEFIPVHPMYTLHIDGKIYDVPANLDHFCDKMIQWFPEDKEQIRAIFDEIQEIGRKMVNRDVASIATRIRKLSQLPILSYLPSFSHSDTPILFSSLFPYAGVAPDQLSALYMFAMMYSYHGGAFYVKGSSQKLSDCLKEAIIEKGGQVLTRRRVEKILISDKQVYGVVDHKENKYTAPIVISNASPKMTFDLLEENVLSAKYMEAVERLKPSYSAVVLYAGIKNDGLEKQLAHEAFYINREHLYGEDFLYDPRDPEQMPLWIVCSPSRLDPTLAPPGHSVVSVMALCKTEVVEQVRSEKGKEEIQRDFLNKFEKVIPGFQKRIVLSELATPRTFQRYLMTQNAAIYGFKKVNQFYPTPIGPRTPIEGLYLTGSWFPNVHGVYGAMMAGESTAKAILNHRKKIILTN